MAGDEKSHVEIGEVLRVSRSTVSRFLAKASSLKAVYGMLLLRVLNANPPCRTQRY
jgi:hypothetical protein